MNKHLVIVNPISGNFFQRRQSKKTLAKIRQGLKADIHYTTSAEHAQALAKKFYANGGRSFLIFGGDGTIFSIVNALYPEAFDDPPIFGLFPAGTGNSMMRDFTSSQQQSLSCVCTNTSKPCDVFELQSKQGAYYFTNLLSLGFVSIVAKMRNRFFAWMGPLGYVCAVLCKLPFFQADRYPIDIDGDRIENPWTFISCNNTRFTGGNMMMAPHANVDDGKIALVLVQERQKVELLRAFPKIFTGTHVDLPFVSICQASHIVFQKPQQQPIMIDGDLMHLCPTSISTHKQALQVYGV